MTDINKKILDAIKENTSEGVVSEADATTIGLIRASFQGTFRYTMLFVIVFQLVFAWLAVYCAYQLFGADLVNTKIEWLSGLVVSVIIFSIARLWFFMELNRLSVLREVKRVELQLALLQDELGARKSD